MNTSALKGFAPALRRDLMEAVERKLDVVLAAATPDYRTTFAPQVAVLGKLARADRAGLIERVAYTWFNRLTALRYLDARGWHPFRARVLTASSAGETQPELLKLTRDGALPAELARHTNASRLDDLLDGRLPSSDPQGEVYRHLVLAACRFYHALLPDLFERLDDLTELLLPDDLLTEHSVVQGFRTEITDEDCADVEVIGWLYQFYISDKKDKVMARKTAVPPADIPAVTQLFTPHWIVRYLVENSLGRLWLLNRPNSRLREQMPYYIEGEPETDFLKIEKPEEIRVLDPAVGSGHMLTYAFDLLYAIYEEEGYPPSDIPGLILGHNLYGVEIDPRAAQLAELALVLKARERSRRFFQPEVLVQPHVIALENVRFDDRELRDYVQALELGPLFNEPVRRLLTQFEEATTFGSLIQPVLGAQDLQQLRHTILQKDVGSQLFLSETHQKVLRVLQQAEYLTQRYALTVANPPYMGQKAMNDRLKSYVEESFSPGKADLYAAFILRNRDLSRPHGYVGMITIPNWLFLESFVELRETLLNSGGIQSLVHNGRGLWGSDFGSCAFILSWPRSGGLSFFKRLFIEAGEVNAAEEIERRFFDDHSFPWLTADIEWFRVVPGAPIAYWLSRNLLRSFSEGKPLSYYAEARQGLATADNGRFLRLWYEVSFARLSLNSLDRHSAVLSKARWFPYNKGGAFRKWYGNSEHVVNWQDDGRELFDFRPRSVVRSPDKYFMPSITWSKVTIAAVSFRFVDAGHIFDVAGCSVFPRSQVSAAVLGGFLNSPITHTVLGVLSPTMNYEVGHVSKLPLMEKVASQAEHDVRPLVLEAVAMARSDWDAFETSWNFRVLPLMRPDLKRSTVAESWTAWKSHCDDAVRRMVCLEEQNNGFWVEQYGLASELAIEVDEDDITLTRADAYRDAADFLSYAVGCMMGRYSVDKPGIILADAADTVANYVTKVGKPLEALTFAPDVDGIVLALDGEWFEDDVVARTRDFLRATYGEASLRENMRWLEESLGKDLRKYFLTDFYREHLQTYKKRPIYWLVQSPRRGFSVLLYLHRYTRDTLNIVLNRYLREYLGKLRSRLAQLTQDLAGDALSARDRTTTRKETEKLTRVLHECEEWERQALLPLAQQRIDLDLDDGVKVNYLKLAGVLAPIPGLAAVEE